jgi:hypothetical protein
MFPFPSSNDQVTSALELNGKVVEVVPTIDPPQLSVAVGGLMELTVQVEFTGVKLATLGTGAVLSSITTDCVCVDVDTPSLYVHVTLNVP